MMVDDETGGGSFPMSPRQEIAEKTKIGEDKPNDVDDVLDPCIKLTRRQVDEIR